MPVIASPAPASGVAVRIADIATHLPDRVLDNSELAAQFPGWTAEKIFEKTGISERRIAAEGETALDLGLQAARTLIERTPKMVSEIDFLIFCSQASDHVLPTSACILQDRLGLPTSIGALDINLGCSGFVYGLSLAAGLIASGAAATVLLITADTYSKYIHAGDRSVRTLFGDGAAATLVTAAADGASSIGPFVFGTDGSGAGDLIVEAGGFRLPASPNTAIEIEDKSGNTRSRNHLYMNGANVMTFSLREVPRAYRALLEKCGTTADDYDYVVLHQANKFMIDALQRKIGLPDAKVPRLYKDVGNTVSSTIPFVLASLLDQGKLTGGTRTMLIGFGVGLSWAATSVVF